MHLEGIEDTGPSGDGESMEISEDLQHITPETRHSSAVAAIQDIAGDEYIPTGTNITTHLRELKAKLNTPSKSSVSAFNEDDFISFTFDEEADISTGLNAADEILSTAAPDQNTGRENRNTPGQDHRRVSGVGASVNDSGRGPGNSTRQFMSVDPLTPVPVPPWVPDRRPYSNDTLTMLNQEIDDYVDYVRPTEAEHSLRKLTIARVRKIVKQIWADAEVHVFGSFQTKLYLPSSDVDIVVVGDSCVLPKCLRQLAKAFEKADTLSRMEVIEKTKVPIIKGVDKLTHFSLDISFNMVNGIKSANIVKRFINDPYYGEGILPLMMILKQFLVQRHLNEVFGGGLGSYGLLIMVSSFLMMHPKLQSGEIRARHNLGILLLEFFELYGKHMDFEHVSIGLSLESTWYASKSNDNLPSRGPRQSILTLLDPQDCSNDVGRGSYNFMSIRREFSRAFNVLQAMIGAGYEQRFKNNQAGSQNPNEHQNQLPRPNFNSPSHVRFEALDKHNVSTGTGREMVTMLGSILTISRSVLEHREFVQKRFEDLHELDFEMWELLNEENKITSDLAISLKRKRGGKNEEDDPEIVYVAVSSNDDEEVDSKEHPSKRSRNVLPLRGKRTQYQSNTNSTRQSYMKKGVATELSKSRSIDLDADESSEELSWGDIKYTDEEESDDSDRGQIGRTLSSKGRWTGHGKNNRSPSGNSAHRGRGNYGSQGNNSFSSRRGNQSHSSSHMNGRSRRGQSQRGFRGGNSRREQKN